MHGGWQPPPGGGSGYGGPPVYGMGAPPYAAPPQPALAIQYGHYEFSELENGIIDKCAGRAKLWGWISAVLGALQLLGGGCGAFANPGLAVYVPYGIVMLIVGITFVGVGNSLRAVVQTQHNDIAHMMSALEKLGGAFLTQSIAFVVTILAGMAIAVLLFVFAVAAAATQ